MDDKKAALKKMEERLVAIMENTVRAEAAGDFALETKLWEEQMMVSNALADLRKEIADATGK